MGKNGRPSREPFNRVISNETDYSLCSKIDGFIGPQVSCKEFDHFLIRFLQKRNPLLVANDRLSGGPQFAGRGLSFATELCRMENDLVKHLRLFELTLPEDNEPLKWLVTILEARLEGADNVPKVSSEDLTRHLTWEAST